MNLLLVDQFSEIGGAQLCVRSLLPEMRRRGWRIEKFVPPPVARYSNGHKTAGDILRYAFDMRAAASAIRSVVRQYSIDLVLVNGPRVLAASVGLDRPVVFYSHSILRKWYARILARWSLDRTGAAVIAASEYVAKTLSLLVSPARIQVIYSGVADLSAAVATHDGPPRVGVLGRIAPEKGQLHFVEAARRCPDAHFLIFGASRFASSGYERRVRARAKGAPVEFRGWMDKPSDALAELDIVAIPSMHYDGAPRVVLEALSAAKPVVAYRSGGIPELIEDGQTGILTDAPTAESLAHSITTLLLDPQRRNKLARNARRAWCERFQLERYQREICDALERAARKAVLNSARA